MRFDAVITILTRCLDGLPLNCTKCAASRGGGGVHSFQRGRFGRAQPGDTKICGKRYSKCPLMTGWAGWIPLCMGTFSHDRKLKNLALPRFETEPRLPASRLKASEPSRKLSVILSPRSSGEFRALLFPRDVAQAYNSAFPAADNFLAAMVKEFSL